MSAHSKHTQDVIYKHFTVAWILGHLKRLCHAWRMQGSTVVAASCRGGVYQLQGEDDCLQLKEKWMCPWINVFQWSSFDWNPVGYLWRDLKMTVHQHPLSNLIELERICEEFQKILKSHTANIIPRITQNTHKVHRDHLHHCRRHWFFHIQFIQSTQTNIKTIARIYRPTPQKLHTISHKTKRHQSTAGWNAHLTWRHMPLYKKHQHMLPYG